MFFSFSSDTTSSAKEIEALFFTKQEEFLQLQLLTLNTYSNF